jgi:hypothetical protein
MNYYKASVISWPGQPVSGSRYSHHWNTTTPSVAARSILSLISASHAIVWFLSGEQVITALWCLSCIGNTFLPEQHHYDKHLYSRRP